jgi:hypothetical protein
MEVSPGNHTHAAYVVSDQERQAMEEKRILTNQSVMLGRLGLFFLILPTSNEEGCTSSSHTATYTINLLRRERQRSYLISLMGDILLFPRR